jgi:long-chain fatty acid transport protein
MGRLLSASLVALAIAFLPSGARSNPADMFGFGTRGPAMGNAMVASDDALSSPIYNAAAGAMAERLELGIGYMYAGIDLDINDQDAEVMDAHGTSTGFVFPFDLDRELQFAFALSTFMPDQFSYRAYGIAATEPQLVMWDNRPHRLVFNAALSVRFAEFLAFGVGLTFLGGLEGNVDFELGTLPGRAKADAAVAAGLPVRTAPVPLVLGMLLTPTDYFRLGLRYSEEVAALVALDILAHVDVAGTNLKGTTGIKTVGFNYFTPRELALGGSFDLYDWTFAAELGWQQWSRLSQVALEIELEVDLTIDTPVEAFDAPAAGFQDVFIPRAGLEYRLPLGDERQLSFRGGYAFVPSPVPDQSGLTSYGDSDRHVMTAGGGFRFEDLWGIPLTPELVLQLQLLERREMRKQETQPGGDFSTGGAVYVAAVGMRAEI